MAERRPTQCGQPVERRGRLVVGEGLDGSGKTTIMGMLRDELVARGESVVISNWNDVRELYSLSQRLIADGFLDRQARAVMSAADLAARYHYVILPALAKGATVLVNKYVVSALGHGLLRGQDRSFLVRLYDFALVPDLTIYFEISPTLALQRKLAGGSLGFWETGVDLAKGIDPQEAMRRFRNGEYGERELAQDFIDFQTRLGYVHDAELEGVPNVIRVSAARRPRDVLSEVLAAVDSLP